MPLPLCNVISVSGIRRTSSSESYNVLVEAYHPIALGDIDRVEFAISSNGGASSTTTVTNRAIWFPDDSEYDDPLPGNWGGGPAPIWCFGVKVEMASYAAGYIDVVPTVYAGSGESVVLDTVRVYNDKDGTDRRPSPKIVYWDYNSGLDANSGLTTGLPVKSFQRACQVAATSLDCGGATIYVNAAGNHQIRGTGYGFGINLYTSGNHWLTVMPRPGLTREEVKITSIPLSEDLDFNWMYFNGAGPNTSVRFSNLTIVSPGFKIVPFSFIKMTVWLEHCVNAPPAPYDEPIFGTGLHIRTIESGCGAADLALKKDGVDKIIVTGSTRKLLFSSGQWGDIVRGCNIVKAAGQIFQPQYKNSVLTNILVEDIYQEYGVSGRFEVTGTFRIENIGVSRYRVQANVGYSGKDFIPDLEYITGSPILGIRLENFSNSLNNNMALEFLSGGYSGGLPWVDVRTTGSHHNLVPESDSSAIVTNGNLRPGNTGTNYNTWGPHSDIFQFIQTESYPVQNIIVSNFAVFPAWETQGIFGSTSNLSGIVFSNYYDGGIGEGPRSFYFAASSNISRNILIRNSYISRLEVSSTDIITDSEIIDSTFGLLSASEGTMSAYTGLVDVRYNHFTGTLLIGGNPTSGRYFSDSNPSVNVNASVIPSSQAYGTASTLWDRPSAWFSGNKGPWTNVALADWSYTEVTGGGSSQVTGQAGITFSTAFAPIAGIKINSNLSEIISTSSIPLPTYATSISQTTLISSGVIPTTPIGFSTFYSGLESASLAPSINLNILPTLSVLTSTGEPVAPLTDGGQFIVYPDVVVAASSIPSVGIAVIPSVPVFQSTGQVFSTSITSVVTSPYSTITFGSSEVNQVTSYAIIGVTDTSTITFQSSDATVSVSLPVIIQVSDTITIIFSSSEVSKVITTVVPIEPEPELQPTIPLYNVTQDSSTITLEQVSPIVDNNILPILVELNSVKNNVTRLPEDSRAVWSQNIIENSNSSQVTRTIVSILTNNYHKFQGQKNRAASRSITNRQQF